MRRCHLEPQGTLPLGLLLEKVIHRPFAICPRNYLDVLVCFHDKLNISQGPYFGSEGGGNDCNIPLAYRVNTGDPHSIGKVVYRMGD